MTWGRTIRGLTGLGLAWGFAWSAAGGLVARVPWIESDLPFPLFFTPFGVVTGVVFAVALAVLEGRHMLERATLPAFAGLGAVSGLLLAAYVTTLRGVTSEVLVFGPALALAGATSGAGSLAVARRSERVHPGAVPGCPPSHA